MTDTFKCMDQKADSAERERLPDLLCGRHLPGLTPTDNPNLLDCPVLVPRSISHSRPSQMLQDKEGSISEEADVNRIG